MQKSDGFLILETSSIPSTPTIINNSDRSVIFEAQLQEAEQPNRNKRIYDKKALFEALQTDVIKEKISKKTMYGRFCPSLQ